MKIKLDEGAVMPTRAHPTDAGLDLYSPQDTKVWPWGRTIINTGVHMEIPEGYVGLLTSKSGLMRDDGITSSGTIDAHYRGPIMAILFNHTGRVYDVKAGQKITQLVILPCVTPELEVVDELDETDRGGNGFGSTGAF